MSLIEGGDVEVSSDEPGYIGAWFSATILKLPRSLKSTKARAMVQYKNLLADDHKTPYREKVKLSNIRPQPPESKSNGGGDRSYKVRDVVDAFHLDGWWIGSVSKVLDSPKRYIVSFANPAEELEFSSDDLRPHWNWVDGKWVKSPKLQEVLVSSDCQESVGLSFASTTKDAGTTIQCESSDAPKCSKKKHDLFCLSKNEIGMLTACKEPEKKKHAKRANIEGDTTPLRPSKKSKDGSLANSLVPESIKKDTKHRKFKSAVRESRKESGKLIKFVIKGSQHPAAEKMDNIKEVAAIKVQQMTKEVESSATRGLLTECMSVTEKSCHVTSEEVLVFSDCQEPGKTEMGLSTASKEPAKQATPEADSTPLRFSKKSKDGSSGNSLVPESDVKDTDPPKVEGVLEENFDLIKKVHRLLKLPVEGQQHPAADEMVEAAIEVSEVQKMKKEAESSVPKELPTECMSGTAGEESCHFIKEGINLQKEHDISRYQKIDGEKTGINRMEQPHVELEINKPQLVLQISQSPSAGRDAAGGAPEEMVSEEHTATEQPHVEPKINVPKLVLQISQSPSAGKDDAAGAPEEMVSEEHTTTEVESSAISGLEKAGSQTMPTERTAVVSATDCQRKIIKVVGESGGSLPENEEQSPLIRYKEMQPGLRKIPSVVMDENNSGHFQQRYSNQQNNPWEKSLEVALQSPLVGMTGDNGPQDGHSIPFVKILPLWKAVESMEIFQVMPQNPHFHPLIELKEIHREGIAVGHMLNFASMVQRISKLTAADPRNHFTSILDALSDFEILGFDLKAIRDRMSELLLMKDKRDRLQYHTEEVKLQVKQHCDKITKLKEEIAANYKKIRELEEKQALLMSKEESETSEFTSLQLSSDVTTEDIQRVENDIESLVGSPW